MEKDTYNAIIASASESKVMKSLVNKFAKSMKQYLSYIRYIIPTIGHNNPKTVLYSSPLSHKGLIHYKIKTSHFIFEQRVKVFCDVRWYATLTKDEKGCISSIDMTLYSCCIRLYDGPSFIKIEDVLKTLFEMASSYVKENINKEDFNVNFVEDYVKSCKNKKKNSHI